MNVPRMAGRLIALALALIAASDQAVRGDEAARQALLELLQSSAAVLQDAQSYGVDVETHWESSGAADAPMLSGDNHHRLLVERPRKFRIEIKPAGAKQADVFCVSDGRNVTTLLASQQLYSQSPCLRADLGLKHNVFVAMNLAGSSVDILLRPDMPQLVLGQVGDVQDLGTKALDGTEVRHFSMSWGPRIVELWIRTGDRPLLEQFTQATETEQVCYQATARLTWSFDAAPADAFDLALPQGARQVEDIYRTLAGEHPASILGSAAPAVKLVGLDGATVPIGRGGDRATVIMFWATWCAPSLQDMPALSTFVQEYQRRKVAFYAVNVGDDPADVRTLLGRQPFQSTVLQDGEGEAISAFGIHRLPAVVVIGPDDTIQAVYQGSSPQIKEQLRDDLERLLAE